MSSFKPRILFESIHKMMADIHKSLEEGNTTDLSTFQNKVTEFCATLNTLPEEEAARFEQEVRLLFDTLKEWSNMITRRQEEIRKEMEKLNQKITAHKAYIAASAASTTRKTDS